VGEEIMIIHLAVVTMGSQQNLDRLFSDCFWQSVWGRVAAIWLLNNGGQMVNVVAPNQHYPSIRYIPCLTNLGCAGGRKYLTEKIMKSRFCGEGFGAEDAIIYLDDDVQVVGHDWIRRLCEPLMGEYSISGVAGRRVTEDVLTEVDMENPMYISGGWCAIRGDVFKDGIGFDTQFHPCYYEDCDVGFQCKAKGKKLIAVGDIGLVHDDNPIGRDMVAVSKHVAENRVRFANKWGYKL
jgi:GT2 family glycosyltransferase